MRVTVVGAGLPCAKVRIKGGCEVANFTAYPVAKRRLDRAADLRIKDPGAVIDRGRARKMEEVMCG